MISCTFRRPARERAAAETATTTATRSTTQVRAEELRIGTLRAIGAQRRFVLVEASSISLAAQLPPGQLLHCRASAATGPLSTADLRVTRERDQAYVAADVLAGEPHVGDLVFLAAGEAMASSPSGPAIPISSVLPPLTTHPDAPATR